ncbi:MAG: penicillin-binding protein A [Oscillospiraceae bacterium]|nr:penicillin-binding protein A [Oscillospiraceae bacterium]
MNKNPKPFRRMHALAIFSAAIFVLFVAVLFDAQVSNGSEYRAKSIASNATWETVDASRGILTDRNGKVLVSNRLTYTLTLNKESFDDNATFNAAVDRLIKLAQETETVWVDTLPLSRDLAPMLYLSSRNDEDFLAFLEKNGISNTLTATQMLQALRQLFEIDAAYDAAEARLIAGVRYELDGRSSYVFSENVPGEMISQIVDGAFPGVTTGVSTSRVYNTEYAAHILGRITRIYEEDWDEYKDKGYSMDALVGESGVEKAFEEYLRGIDGTRIITTDENGKITGELYTTEPKPGDTVALTLDIDLQEVTERALAKTVEEMIDEDSNQRGAAAAVVKVGSGEVLSLASYPTFDLSTFSEDYVDLLADERLPMFNRAVDGTYAPGSTFKMCTAVAALETGVITPSSIIRCEGIYTYYKDPQPRCWVWANGYTHGRINVSQAITDSCNYFFYEVGRLLGQDALNDYAMQFGLGQNTGIEIGDSAGALASANYAERYDLEWSDGQTLTAAIGQSYNLFTPLQLANYTATLVGDGEYYTPHLLKSVKSYDNEELVYVYDEAADHVVEMSEETKRVVTQGMHNLTTGTLAGAFNNCVVSAGAKTGSAQVGTDIANGVFVCYAPYENPEIAVAIVIEKGGAGAALASTAVEIINAYFTNPDVGGVIPENTLLK